jgi:pyridoxine 4-dehydrogenase
MSLNRMGYGAMQLAGPQVWGPPRDVDAAIAVLREAIATGVNHIDTSDYYGPHVTNQIIKQAKTSTTWHTAMTMPSSMRSFSKA